MYMKNCVSSWLISKGKGYVMCTFLTKLFIFCKAKLLFLIEAVDDLLIDSN